MTADDDKHTPARRTTGSDVDAFLSRVAATPAPQPKAGQKGRLLFALDATASRQPTWAQASRLQMEMFAIAAGLGGLEMQVAFYRGFGEFKATPWLTDGADLLRRMGKVSCVGGQTQIARVLRHALNQTRERKVAALVFVGDCVEENPDEICHLAGEMGLNGLPAFLFHEGPDMAAYDLFRQAAKLSGGACCRFDVNAPRELRDLLEAVAVFAAGGRKALMDYGRRSGSHTVLQLTHQMGG
ncbi:MAG: VWA domain-containing protein [Caenispirillum bisanense]|nr:VWA domain-containing protein [Caenispirillum bisanense]MCA1972375.1 VWA domain-containing protein [Caenispirillum sp.]